MRSRGIVLVIVLTLLGAISFMVSYLDLWAREEARIVAAQEEDELLRRFAFPVAQKIVEAVLIYQADAEGVPRQMSFRYRAGRTLGEGEITVELSPEGERLNLNEADEEELTALFEEAGLPEDRALTMAQSLIDWRDQDDEPLPSGAERDAYQIPGRPPNKPLSSLNEVLSVRGWDPYVFWVNPRLFDLVTIYASGKGGEKGEQKGQTGEGARDGGEEEEVPLVRIRSGGTYRLVLRWDRVGSPAVRYTLIFKLEGTRVKRLFEAFL